MPRPKLVIFVDVHSAFAYLAFTLTRTSPIFKQCDITYTPVYLVGIVKGCGIKPPWSIKNKPEWIRKELSLWSRKFNIPIADTFPPGFPTTSTVRVQRALCAITLACPHKLSDALEALYHAFWVERKAIQSADGFQPVIETVLGLETARKVTQMSETDQVRTLLATNTDLAISEGACGLPWMIATNAQGDQASFWGFDHLGVVVEFLGIQRPVGSILKEEGWRVML